MIRDKAPTALRGQINRMDSLHSQPSSWCTIEPHRKPGKEKITTPKVIEPAWTFHHDPMCRAPYSLGRS